MAEANHMFTGANHVCVVTADVDRAVRTYADGYGLGPWNVYNYDSSNMTVSIRGEPVDFKMRVGLCQLGPSFMIELIQPVGEGNLYAESLAVHGGADHVHHLKLEVTNFDRAFDHLEGRGLSKVLDGRFNGVDSRSITHGVYFDTQDELGFVVEIGELSPDFAMAEPEYTYPPQVADRPVSGR